MSVSTLKKALLGKVESTPSTDAVPTGASNAIRVESVGPVKPGIDPIVQKMVKATWGDEAPDMNAKMMSLDVSFYLRGNGSIGTALDFAPLLHCSAHTVTVNAGVDVTIDPITLGADSDRQTSTFYYYEDGLEYQFVGAVASFSLEAPIGGFLMAKATIVAPWKAPTAVALPGTLTYQSAAPIQVKSSDVVTDNAAAIAVGSFSFDSSVATDVTQLIGENQALVTDRPKPSIKLTKRSLATAADFTRLLALTEAAFSSVFGSAGNRFTLSAPAAQFESVGGAEDGLFNNRDITLQLNESTGDDAYQIVFD